MVLGAALERENKRQPKRSQVRPLAWAHLKKKLIMARNEHLGLQRAFRVHKWVRFSDKRPISGVELIGTVLAVLKNATVPGFFPFLCACFILLIRLG